MFSPLERSTARLALFLSGGFRVTLDGEPVTGFQSDKVRALLAYQAVNSQNIRESQVGNTNEVTYNINVEESTQLLKVTLVWSDPAAAPNTTGDKTLISDLDLELVAPDGTTIHHPWVLDPNNPAQAATTGVDNTNNVEQVLVSNPATGTWTVRIKGTSVPQGPQSFSVVFTSSISTGGSSFVHLPLLLN